MKLPTELTLKHLKQRIRNHGKFLRAVYARESQGIYQESPRDSHLPVEKSGLHTLPLKPNLDIGQAWPSYLQFFALLVFLYTIIHLLMVSLGAFFHFLLDQRVGNIENWNFRNGQELMIISKVAAFILVIRYIRVTYIDPSSDFKLRDLYLFSDFRRPGRLPLGGLVFSILFAWGFVLAQGKWEANQDAVFYWEYFFLSYVGNLVFFGTDLLLMFSLRFLHPFHDRKDVWAYYIGLPLLLTLSTRLSFPYQMNFSPWIFFQALSLLMIFELMLRDIRPWLAYLGGVVAPLSALFGLDPIWRSAYSPFTFGEGIFSRFNFWECAFMAITPLIYWWVSSSNRFFKDFK